MKESPYLPRCERCELRLTPLVVQSSNSRWTAAPYLPQALDQTGRSDRSEAVRPAVPPKDDIVGWPDELLIDFPDYSDCNPRLRNWASSLRTMLREKRGRSLTVTTP